MAGAGLVSLSLGLRRAAASPRGVRGLLWRLSGGGGGQGWKGAGGLGKAAQVLLSIDVLVVESTQR